MQSENTLLASNIQILVFTDFDGTLLDHYTYSFENASECMARLTEAGIPIIPNTSKTFAEVKELLVEMKLNSGFITENGAAVYMPKGFLPEKPRGAVWKNGYWVKSFAQPRSYWQDLIKRIKYNYPNQYEAFGDMDIQRIVELTGLGVKKAELAATRQYSEPLFWTGSDAEQEQFIKDIKGMGAHPLKGGRFLHVCGDSNKGKALQWLSNEYKRQHQDMHVKSIALGDGNNDIDMLEVADFAVRISSPVHSAPQLKRTKHNYLSKAHGPEGWSQVMNQLIPEKK